jgi:hypothetical protein
MTAPDWTPGDPLHADNGCGSIPTVNWTPEQRQAAVNEDDTPPPWYRPDGPLSSFAFTRSCAPCGVRWRGDDPCWNCGEDPAA